MMIYKSPVNWHESYQNPYKGHGELACNTSPDSISAEDRALYLGLLLQLSEGAAGEGNHALPGFGALH